MIAFSCPHCGAQLQMKPSQAGKTKPCPGCSRVIQAPAAGSSSLSGPKSGTRSGNQTATVCSTAEETVASSSKTGVLAEYSFLAPPEGPEELGRLGPYAIRKVLGTGAMGIVFQAQDVGLKRMVALKVMKPSLAAHADFHRRFLREAQLAAAIEHEHIVTIYQVGDDRGVPYLAMKLLQGESLEDRLNRTGGRLPLEEVLRIGREVAEGLDAAHKRGLVHRDIKPANIWLEEGRDKVKIVDFGLARGASEDQHFTQAGAVIGTPSYMAPEQANGEEVDGRCDLFSLGSVLYRASTGQLPFPGKDTLSVLTALATKTPVPPRQLNPQVPPALSDLVMRLLAKKRGQRPQTGHEIVELIEAIERGETGEEADGPAPEEAPAPRQRTTEKTVSAVTTAEASGVAKATDSGQRKRLKKGRPRGARRKKRREGEKDWGRVVLVTSLVLLGVAVMVLLLGFLRHRIKSRAAVREERPAIHVLADRLIRPIGIPPATDSTC